jgi:site-specific DNA-methyltransferase (adenine-specific)
VVFDVAAGEALDQQSGVSNGKMGMTQHGSGTNNVYGKFARSEQSTISDGVTDRGGASRFFTQADFGPDDWPFVYQAKPGKKERNAGLDALPEKDVHRYGAGIGEGKDPNAPARDGNHHPTVKPVALMRHLVRLVTPPDGTVLDPFTGSGTTLVAAVLEGFNAVGCEMTDEYLPIIEGRVAWARQEAARVAEEADRQQSLFD